MALSYGSLEAARAYAGARARGLDDARAAAWVRQHYRPTTPAQLASARSQYHLGMAATQRINEALSGGTGTLADYRGPATPGSPTVSVNIQVDITFFDGRQRTDSEWADLPWTTPISHLAELADSLVQSIEQSGSRIQDWTFRVRGPTRLYLPVRPWRQ